MQAVGLRGYSDRLLAPVCARLVLANLVSTICDSSPLDANISNHFSTSKVGLAVKNGSFGIWVDSKPVDPGQMAMEKGAVVYYSRYSIFQD